MPTCEAKAMHAQRISVCIELCVSSVDLERVRRTRFRFAPCAHAHDCWRCADVFDLAQNAAARSSASLLPAFASRRSSNSQCITVFRDHSGY